MHWELDQRVSWKMSWNRSESVLQGIRGYLLDSPLSILIQRQFRTIVVSKKFFLIVFAFILPLAFQLLYVPAPKAKSTADIKDFFESFYGKYVLNLMSALSGDKVQYGAISGLLFQILVILICSEFLAQEYEEGTISILLVKPVRRSEILFGKLFGFMFFSAILGFITTYGYTALLVWQMQGDVQNYIDVALTSATVCYFVLLLGIFTLATFMLALSAFFSKGLYAALTGILVLFAIEIFVTGIYGPEYSLSYQLGIILEEFVILSNTNLYKGDWLFSLVAIVLLNAFFLLFAMINFFRREFP